MLALQNLQSVQYTYIGQRRIVIESDVFRRMAQKSWESGASFMVLYIYLYMYIYLKWGMIKLILFMSDSLSICKTYVALLHDSCTYIYHILHTV